MPGLFHGSSKERGQVHFLQEVNLTPFLFLPFRT